MNKTDLSKYNNAHFDTGAGVLTRGLWYMFSQAFFASGMILPYGVKRSMLRMFGAKVGKGVVIKPRVLIKYPWRLEIGDYSWIGEKVWIDNLVKVTIGPNVCLSQGAMLLTGNHDFSKETFDLITEEIVLEEGVWVGAKALVAPGSILVSHSVITAQSMISGNTEAYKIYQGNPAVVIKERVVN